MKFEELTSKVPASGLFTTGQILSGERSATNVRRQVDRWVKRGRIIQLRRGVYVLAAPYAKTELHPFTAANALKKASYVSLQSALSYYGMIPEYVPMTTSVTTGRPEELSTPIGRFQFRHVVSSLFFGFQEVEIGREQTALVATPQKALLDLLYLTPGSDQTDYLCELRLEPSAGFDYESLREMARQCGSAKVERAVNILMSIRDKEEN